MLESAIRSVYLPTPTPSTRSPLAQSWGRGVWRLRNALSIYLQVPASLGLLGVVAFALVLVKASRRWYAEPSGSGPF